MNSREKTLLGVLVAILASGLFVYIGWNYWWAPMRDYNAQIVTLNEENTKLDTQLIVFNKEKKKLELARLRSLPTAEAQAGAQYMDYMSGLLAKAGMTKIMVIRLATKKVAVANPIPNVKEVGHQIVTFSVDCRGELGSFIEAMEQMQHAPLEHRIKSLTINRVDLDQKKGASNELSIRMVVETLLVAKSENKSGLPPGISAPSLLLDQFHAPINFGMIAAALWLHQATPESPKNRDYADIARRNIFVGLIPASPEKPVNPQVTTKPQKELPPKEPSPPSPPSNYIPDYIYLTHLAPDKQTAYMRNRLYDRPTDKEMTLIAKEGTGYDTFVITGPETDLGKYVYFRAKVLRVELRQIYFQVGNGSDNEKFKKDGVYVLPIREPLANAKYLSSNMTKIELQDEGLYSLEFEQVEMKSFLKEKADKEARDNKGKPTKKKGKN